MSAPMPEGWERVDADPSQAALLELLHPVVVLELGEPLYLAATAETTGTRFAGPGDELAVRSIGNNVARVENRDTAESALVQVSQLAECQPRPWSFGA
jgi:hypothetical protein